MLYAGLDLSRKRLDFHLLDAEGATVEVGAAPPDADGLRGLTRATRSPRRADPRRDRVDERRPVRARPARARGLAGRDRRRAEGQGAGPAGLQDRPDRRLGAGRARRAATWCRRSGCPTRACAPSANGPAGGCTWCATARSLKQRIHAVLLALRQALPGLGSVRRRAAASCSPGSELPEPWAGNDRRQPASDRRARPRDRRLRARAAPARRRPPLRAAAADRARDRLGARLHDRRRDRRHQPLRHPDASSPATPASARASTSPASATCAARSARTARATCAGRSSRPPPTPAPHPVYRDRYQQHQGAASANSAAPRSPRSTSPADWPRRSGTCSPATNPSLPQAPPTPWPPDGP